MATTAPPGLLRQIFNPGLGGAPAVTNIYDSLGRVAEQTNANGFTWRYFFAGYRSEEDDPLGNQHVLYYNPRGKALFDIQDYAGLGLLTRFGYDGLDRLTSTVLPGGSGTSYAYAASPNPWANNLAAATRNPSRDRRCRPPPRPTLTKPLSTSRSRSPARRTPPTRPAWCRR